MKKLDCLLISQSLCHVGVSARPCVSVRGMVDRKISNLHQRAVAFLGNSPILQPVKLNLRASVDALKQQ